MNKNLVTTTMIHATAALFAALLTCQLTSAAVAAAPAFPCTGDLSPTEAVICSDDGLASLDRSLAALYNDKFSSLPVGQKNELETTEKAWLADRNSCGTNKSCINNAYLARISQLGGTPPLPNGDPTSGLSCNKAVGATQAATYVNQCIQISTATRPPCNAANSCAMIIAEIRRSCALVGASAPSFCAAYKN